MGQHSVKPETAEMKMPSDSMFLNVEELIQEFTETEKAEYLKMAKD